MDTNGVVELLQPWIKKHKRIGWKPNIKIGDSSPRNSKFAGTPWMTENDSWPLCKSCQQPMQFFLQLNLATLPKSLGGKFGDGLLQLFYCVRDRNGYCDAYDGWEPFSRTAKMVRIIKPIGKPQTIDLAGKSQLFPAKTIIDWEEVEDYPDPQEHSELGLNYDYDWGNELVSIVCEGLNLEIKNIEDEYLAEKISKSSAGDKLWGWPVWIQQVEYPKCPTCSNRMELIFQIDSEDNLPYMFGDLGTGHITQCAEHKEVVAFGWACS